MSHVLGRAKLRSHSDLVVLPSLKSLRLKIPLQLSLNAPRCHYSIHVLGIHLVWGCFDLRRLGQSHSVLRDLLVCEVAESAALRKRHLGAVLRLAELRRNFILH